MDNAYIWIFVQISYNFQLSFSIKVANVGSPMYENNIWLMKKWVCELL